MLAAAILAAIAATERRQPTEPFCWDEPQVLGCLQEAGALPEAIRQKAVDQLEELALILLDSGVVAWT
jgi:hypothetical protein